MTLHEVVDRTERVPMGSPEYYEAFTFLLHEAELLDSDDLEAWLGLLADEVDYRMPVQTTRLKGQPATGASHLLHDDAASLALRVKRLVGTETSWANNPPARTRRFVSNVRVTRLGDERVGVKSYLLLLRNRLDDADYDIISAGRDDVLVRSGGELRLTSRSITVDQARLGVSFLSLFL